jgi:hypothetical protein
MDHLPSELVSIIAAHLVLEDLVNKPFSRLTGTICFESGEVDDWLDCGNNARSNICNFRLVYRKFYNSSVAGFGDVLGHRVFRTTQIGLEDLQAISRVARLQPHIRTLTFETARFANAARISVLKAVLEAVPEPERSRLQAAISEAHTWERAHRGSRYAQEVVPLLERLPHLRTLRIFLPDLSTAENHLRGWLAAGDAEILSQAAVKRSSLPLVHTNLYHGFDRDLTTLNPIFNALKASKTDIWHLRTGPWMAVLPTDFFSILQNTGMISNLTNLRFDISPDHLKERDSFTSCCFRNLFEQITSVTHLTLAMEQIPEFEQYAEATRNLMESLRLLNRPQYLVIRGSWEYVEDELIDAVTTHSESLEVLSLKGPVMAVGDWTSTVRRLMQLPLRHLEVSDMCAWMSSRSEIGAVDDVMWQELVSGFEKDVEEQTTCEVYLSSGGAEYLFCPHAK